ncbi:hypothetical protein HK101_004326, partial [Irineochytrium annulatum]
MSFSDDGCLRSLHAGGTIIVADTSGGVLSYCELPLDDLSSNGVAPPLHKAAFLPAGDRIIWPHHEAGRCGVRGVSFTDMLKPWEHRTAAAAAAAAKKVVALMDEWVGKASEPLPAGERYKCVAASSGKHVCAGTTAGRVR